MQGCSITLLKLDDELTRPVGCPGEHARAPLGRVMAGGGEPSTLEAVLAWIDGFAATVTENKDYLTRLDSAIGDADHGINMNRGMKAALERLAAITARRHRGGSEERRDGDGVQGRRGQRAALRHDVPPARRPAGREGDATLEASGPGRCGRRLSGITARGKAELGDKTMVDALSRRSRPSERAAGEGAAARDGLAGPPRRLARAWRPPSRWWPAKGRASYLGRAERRPPGPGGDLVAPADARPQPTHGRRKRARRHGGVTTTRRRWTAADPRREERRMAQYAAAVDQGTTSTRFMIFDHGGNVIGIDQKEHEQIYPKPGWVEHDPAEVWDTDAGGDRRRPGERPGSRASDLAAVGVTNQRETTVVWDRNTGEPVYNAIVWQDTRTDKIWSTSSRPTAGRTGSAPRSACRWPPTSRGRRSAGSSTTWRGPGAGPRRVTSPSGTWTPG